MGSMTAVVRPEVGSFLSLRGREWLAQDIDAATQPHVVRLACVSDDAQGERAEIILDAEVGAALIDTDPWSAIGKNGTDSASVFAAFLRTLKWTSATAAERDLFQAPFRAGIRLELPSIPLAAEGTHVLEAGGQQGFCRPGRPPLSLGLRAGARSRRLREPARSGGENGRGAGGPQPAGPDRRPELYLGGWQLPRGKRAAAALAG